MISSDVGQRAGTEWASVILVHRPRAELQIVDGSNYQRVASERHAGPFVDNLLRSQVRVPGETSETVEIGHRERTAQPVRIHADVGDSGEAAQRTVKHSARHQVLHRRVLVVDAHVEIEHFFPHRYQKAKMLLLPRVLLRDLQFHGFVGAVQAGKKG